MALLTAVKTYDNLRQPTLGVYTLKDATNYFAGSFCALNLTTQRLVPFDGTAGLLLLGRLYDADNGGADATGKATGRGDDALTVYAGPTGKPQGRVILNEELLPAVAITGLTASTQIGDPVFLNADDQTFTVTVPATNPVIVGEVADFTSAAVGDLLVYSYWTRSLLQKTVSSTGGGGFWFHIATAPGAATGAIGVAASAFGLLIPAPFHGKIVDAFAINNGVALTGGPVTITPSIVPNGGANTPTTGGAMVITAALAAKTKITATAITALNEFHVGDTLDLTTSTVTAITAGQIDIFVKLQPVKGT